MTTSTKPLTRSQQDHVRHYYPMGYGVIPIAHALCIEVARVRNYLASLGMPRHGSGGANFKRSKNLPPLPMLGVKRRRTQRPDYTPRPTGDLKAWNQPRWGWRVHDTTTGANSRANYLPSTALAQAYQRKAG